LLSVSGRYDVNIERSVNVLEAAFKTSDLALSNRRTASGLRFLFSEKILLIDSRLNSKYKVIIQILIIEYFLENGVRLGRMMYN